MENIVGFNNEYSEEQLYEKFITQIYSDLYRYIYVMVRNEHLAEDILQEVFIKGYNNFEDLLDKTKFKSWMFTIAKRETIRQLKKVSRELIIDDHEWEVEISKNFYFDKNHESSSEIEEALIDIINSLDSESKDIILLIYHADLSFEDISIILNINYNTLKSKHKRIKEKIYKRLLSKGFIK